MDTYRKAIKGRQSRRDGQYFEQMIESASMYYEERGIAVIDKTPEPMKELKPVDRNSGKFICCFAKQAQPDFKGVLKDATMILFDAKHTDSDRIRREAVTEEQEKCFERYAKLGTQCFLVISINFENFYRVPWETFRDMKKIYGHKYMSVSELEPYRLMIKRGELLFLEGLELRDTEENDENI